jgi:hypothetical protein
MNIPPARTIRPTTRVPEPPVAPITLGPGTPTGPGDVLAPDASTGEAWDSVMALLEARPVTGRAGSPGYHRRMSTKSAAAAPAVQDEGADGASADTGHRIRVLRDQSELAGVRDAWLRLVGDSVLVDPDFYEAALGAEEQIVRPHVVVLERSGEVDAMLVGRIEQLEFGVRAGYRKLYSPRVTSVTIVQGGVLGEVDEDTFRLLLASVHASLAAGEGDVAIFRYLPLESPLYALASSGLPFRRRQHFAGSEIHWELTLPGSLDEILGALSSSTRQTVKRYTRKLEREYEGRIETRVFTDVSELDEFFHAVEPVSAKTYQRALGVSFGDMPRHRERTRVSMENGWFRGYVLYLDGLPVAFHYGDLYRGRFRHGRPGYDPELADFRVGTYLMLRLFEDLIAHPEARVVDYGVGDADYKRRFGTRSWREGNVVLYAPSLRAGFVNMTRTGLQGAVLAAKKIFGKGAFYQRVKRGWRRRLTDSEKG